MISRITKGEPMSNLLLYLLLVNTSLFFLMGLDKQKAIKHQRRIPEKTLLLIGFLGGGPMGLFSQKLFHHKTKKKYFTFTYLVGSIIALILVFF